MTVPKTVSAVDGHCSVISNQLSHIGYLSLRLKLYEGNCTIRHSKGRPKYIVKWLCMSI